MNKPASWAPQARSEAWDFYNSRTGHCPTIHSRPTGRSPARAWCVKLSEVFVEYAFEIYNSPAECEFEIYKSPAECAFEIYILPAKCAYEIYIYLWTAHLKHTFSVECIFDTYIQLRNVRFKHTFYLWNVHMKYTIYLRNVQVICQRSNCNLYPSSNKFKLTAYVWKLETRN